MQVKGSLSGLDLEELFQSVASHIDAQPPPARIRFMCKAFFLLAQTMGDASAAMEALQTAAAAGQVEGPAPQASHGL
jgi:hypothetical protein